MGGAVLAGLLGIQRRMNAAKNDERATLTCRTADFVAAMGVGGVDADADDVAALDERCVEWLQRFVDEVRITILAGCRGSEHVQPSRRDHSDTKLDVARIDEVYAHLWCLTLPQIEKR
jgi:hypothetical protein